MSNIVVTVDIDWACEPAIEETLDFLKDKNILPTVFTTHHSPRVEASIGEIEVGLHPYFDLNSSHGSTITEVVKYVMDLPHNLPAFRCHRFAICNLSRQAMAEAGMLISSNVCTDLEIVFPFKDRFGLLEVPIFLEDGGYLWKGHSLEVNQPLMENISGKEIKVITIHPMHFVINTPNFHYMHDIKKSVTRKDWKNMRTNTLNTLRWKGRGIRDFTIELLQCAPQTSSLGVLLATC
ncbi:MAG: hypothetical protein AB2993_07355 (plasmid) [Candidatus Symbiodolus clandestinus]